MTHAECVRVERSVKTAQLAQCQLDLVKAPHRIRTQGACKVCVLVSVERNVCYIFNY